MPLCVMTNHAVFSWFLLLYKLLQIHFKTVLFGIVNFTLLTRMVDCVILL